MADTDSAGPAPARPDTPKSANARIDYAEGGTWPLVRRHLINVALMIVTIGLYRFWAITIMRQIIWRRVRFGGQPLEYTGTGIEIFLGFIRVFLFILLPLGIIFVLVELGLEREMPTANGSAIELVDLVYLVVVLMLIEMGRFLSWRYRISRTRWRGIRGRIELPASNYLIVAAGAAAMIVFSGWLLKPVVDLYRAKNVVGALNIGGLKGIYRGGAWGLLGTWIAIWIGYGLLAIGCAVVWFWLIGIAMVAGSDTFFGLVILSGGLAVFWLSLYMFSVYRVAFWHLVCTFSTVGPVRIRFDGSAASLTRLTFGNWLILALSLGLLAPVTWERKIRYMAAHVHVSGMPDPAELRQVGDDDSAIGGEGLAGDFDLA
ncbi:MAG: DUF898 family protein [Thalassobaculaceae bacterium]|nr:DUF898 family protein [Thalassobaculaceae bacterium]